jgi:hypothetical protein
MIHNQGRREAFFLIYLPSPATQLELKLIEEGEQEVILD